MSGRKAGERRKGFSKFNPSELKEGDILPVAAVIGYIDGFGTSWGSGLWGVKFALRK